MKRILVLLIITVIGLILSFVDAYYALLLYAFYSFASPMQLVTSSYRAYELSFVVGAVLMGMTFYQRRALFLISPITVATYAYILACFASLAVPMRMDLGAAFREVDVIAKLGILAMVMPVLLDSLERIRYLIAVVGGCVGLLAAYYGFFGLLSGATNISGTEGWGQNNEYAAIVVGGLPYIFFLGTLMKRKIHRIAAAGVFVMNLVAIAIALSRGAFIATAVVLTCFILKLKNKLLLCALLFTVVPLLGLAAYMFHISSLAETVEYDAGRSTRLWRSVQAFFMELGTMENKAEDIPSAASRLHYWKVALEMYSENPWFGIGYGQFEKKYDEYDFSAGKYGRARAVHNTPLVILAETGLIGEIAFAALALLCAIGLVNAKRVARALGDDNRREELLCYISLTQISFVGIFICACFLSLLRQEILWILPTLSLALERVARREHEKGIGARQNVGRQAARDNQTASSVFGEEGHGAQAAA